MKRKAGIADLIVLVVLAAAALCVFLFSHSGAPAQTAEIICDRQTAQTINLSDVKEPYELSLANGLVLQVKQGAVCVLESSCPDKLCVNCGWLDTAGDTAVCLPCRTVVKITGTLPDGEPDAIAY